MNMKHAQPCTQLIEDDSSCRNYSISLARFVVFVKKGRPIIYVVSPFVEVVYKLDFMLQNEVNICQIPL